MTSESNYTEEKYKYIFLKEKYDTLKEQYNYIKMLNYALAIGLFVISLTTFMFIIHPN